MFAAPYFGERYFPRRYFPEARAQTNQTIDEAFSQPPRGAEFCLPQRGIVFDATHRFVSYTVSVRGAVFDLPNRDSVFVARSK